MRESQCLHPNDKDSCAAAHRGRPSDEREIFPVALDGDALRRRKLPRVDGRQHVREDYSCRPRRLRGETHRVTKQRAKKARPCYTVSLLLSSSPFLTSSILSPIRLASSSQRLKQTRSGNVKESGFINKSLYTLGKVINGISNNGGTLLPGTTRRHIPNIPFRESILTKLLVQSLVSEAYAPALPL